MNTAGRGIGDNSKQNGENGIKSVKKRQKSRKRAENSKKQQKTAEIDTKSENFLLKRGDLGKISDRKSGESGNLIFKNSGSRKECSVARLGDIASEKRIFLL